MAEIKVKLEEWLKYLQDRVDIDVYVWGGNGELLVNLLPNLVEKEMSGHTDSAALKNIDRVLTLVQKRLLTGTDILKIHGEDCSGLAVGFLMSKGILKHDTNAAGLCDMISEEIDIEDVQAGDFLFYTNKKHVGYAISNKYAIECKNHDVGVVQTRIEGRGWGIAKRPTWYEGTIPSKPVLKRILKLDNPMMRGDDVEQAQEMLNAKKYSCGEADGIFGKKTDIAVRNFQNDSGLYVDGIIGEKTAKKLGFKWGGN